MMITMTLPLWMSSLHRLFLRLRQRLPHQRLHPFLRPPKLRQLFLPMKCIGKRLNGVEHQRH